MVHLDMFNIPKLMVLDCLVFGIRDGTSIDVYHTYVPFILAYWVSVYLRIGLACVCLLSNFHQIDLPNSNLYLSTHSFYSCLISMK